MREIVTTMTQRGQVTVPAEVRRLLGLKPYDKVGFTIVEGEVKVAPAKHTLASVYGSLKMKKATNDDYKTEIRKAKEEKVRRDMRKHQRQ